MQGWRQQLLRSRHGEDGRWVGTIIALEVGFPEDGDIVASVFV